MSLYKLYLTTYLVFPKAYCDKYLCKKATLCDLDSPF